MSIIVFNSSKAHIHSICYAWNNNIITIHIAKVIFTLCALWIEQFRAFFEMTFITFFFVWYNISMGMCEPFPWPLIMFQTYTFNSKAINFLRSSSSLPLSTPCIYRLAYPLHCQFFLCRALFWLDLSLIRFLGTWFFRHIRDLASFVRRNEFVLWDDDVWSCIRLRAVNSLSQQVRLFLTFRCLFICILL